MLHCSPQRSWPFSTDLLLSGLHINGVIHHGEDRKCNVHLSNKSSKTSIHSPMPSLEARVESNLSFVNPWLNACKKLKKSIRDNSRLKTLTPCQEVPRRKHHKTRFSLPRVRHQSMLKSTLLVYQFDLTSQGTQFPKRLELQTRKRSSQFQSSSRKGR